MAPSPSGLPGLPRPGPRSNMLAHDDKKVYEMIEKSGNKGIWSAEMKKYIPENILNKSLKLLLSKNLIKLVANVHNPRRKVYMLANLQPSEEISGGTWYSGKEFDTELIDVLKQHTLRFITKMKVVILDKIADSIKTSEILKVEVRIQEVKQVVDSLILDREIEAVLSNGSAEFLSIPKGKVCYRCRKMGHLEPASFVSVPCGVCPVINECTPDGVISPKTCEYYQRWLDF
ncbi:hypothetical protein AMTR_s00019p00255850 [Amborella trichopoda]|uniref:DNA-directed RNA polymerase III subunit RPC6 n=2 Tax=Amborella trichopoda TaxID=13333 RepID=W1PHL3_AMBTC|nr:hypothetical protein AMTR_s00019p00255850 [Amborella trichopoda]